MDSSSPLDSSLSPRRAYLGVSAPLLNGVWSDGGWNKFHLAYHFLIYRGPYPGERHLIHSGSLAPFWKAERVSPFDFVKMKVLCRSIRLGPYIFAVHLH